MTTKMFNGHNHRVVLDDGAYAIFEKNTEQNILRFAKNDQAKTVAQHFEAGGGFGGWTPAFFLFDPRVELDKLKDLVMGPEEAVA